MEKQKKTTSKRNGQFEWQSSAEKIAHNFFHHLVSRITDPIKQQIEKTQRAIQKNIFGNLFMLIGIIFLMIGSSLIINDLVGISQGVGYAMMGFLALIIGYIVLRSK